MKKTYLLLGLILTLGVAPLALAADATPPATKMATAVPAKAPAAAPAATVPVEPPVAVLEPKAPEKAAEKPTQDTQKVWQGALVIGIEAIVAIVTPILSLLLMVLIRKWNLRIEQEKLDWVLDKSLGAGEQKLKQLLKDGKEVEGPAIVKAALETGGPLLEKYGLAKKFGDWLTTGIEARLGEKVIAAGGAKKPALKGISELIAKPIEKPVD